MVAQISATIVVHVQSVPLLRDDARNVVGVVEGTLYMAAMLTQKYGLQTRQRESLNSTRYAVFVSPTVNPAARHIGSRVMTRL